jgi:hypothetical protein
MNAWLAKFWNSHIQFTLGCLEAGVGALETIDANTINLIGGFFGPKYGPVVSKAVQVGAGLAIAFRARQVRRGRTDA